MPHPEIQKLEMLIAETKRRLGLNAAVAFSEQFFRLWEETCQPFPFRLPPEGLTLDKQLVFPGGDWDENGGPVVHVAWNDSTVCPWIICETVPQAFDTVLIRSDETGLHLIPGPTIEIDLEEALQGEYMEGMAEALAAIKTKYPSLNLLRAKDTLLRETLAGLAANQKRGNVFTKIKNLRALDRKRLVQRVVADMAEDEISSQLSLTLDFADEPKDTTPAPKQPESPVFKLPHRGKLEVMQEIALLVEAEMQVLKSEVDFFFNFAKHDELSPLQSDLRQCVKVSCCYDQYAGMHEGARFTIFPEGKPRMTLGTFVVDIVEENDIYGTIIWKERGFVTPLDEHLFAMPHKGPQEFITHQLDAFKDRLFATNTMEDELFAAKAVLGLVDVPFRMPPTESSSRFPKLDPQQVCAAMASIDSENPVVLVQGPPGTGKTSVLEIIIRELARQNKRILVAAPSNTAVDNIARRIVDLPLLRHASLQDSIAADVRESYWSGDVVACDEFVQKNRKQHCEVHAGTLVGLLRSPTLKELISRGGDYDVIIFDEAGMAASAEALLCLGLAKRAIFFGDAQQLPPFPMPEPIWEILRQNHPAMTLSQERFIGGSILGWIQHFRSIPAILLKTCYRCQNPRLIRFASLLFYNGQVKTDSRSQYYQLSYRDRMRLFPAESLTFISTSKLPEEARAEQLQCDGQQLGYTNPTEAAICIQLLKKALTKYPKDEITIISPYKKQVKLIRQLAKEIEHTEDEENWDNFLHQRIATVDSFQGGESDVVIISYVRSGGKSVGFIDDPNRVNVTHTRSRKEMTVIGDLDFLASHATNSIFERMARSFRRDGQVIDADESALSSATCDSLQ